MKIIIMFQFCLVFNVGRGCKCCWRRVQRSTPGLAGCWKELRNIPTFLARSPSLRLAASLLNSSQNLLFLQNFVKNSINVRDQQTLGELWEVFSTAIKPVRNSTFSTEASYYIMCVNFCCQVTSEGDHSVSITAETNTDPKGVNEEDCEAAPVMKKEMKKEKKKEKVQESVTCDVAGVDSGEKDEEMKTKRKKRKRKTADTVVEDVSESPDVDEMGDSCKPKKEKKRKSESVSVALTEADQVEGHTTPTKKKKKSKKEKSALVEEIDGVEVGVGPMQVALEYINSHRSSEGAGEKKAKKKKRKSEGEGVVEEGLDEPKHKHKTHS